MRPPRLSDVFPDVAFEMYISQSTCLVRLIDDGPLSPFQGRSFSASSVYSSLLQANDGVMSMALLLAGMMTVVRPDVVLKMCD